ncbi:cytochrome P450 superfamily protein [Actinidia rufa]|uniref:Cytochrome P450 superfamily protein n=1 Tax=Actinidia rufa TaxID=165716 RepID=A0A7J0DYZ4_9ERIC|nr:cytochrome P450 superfamily protein [Actinidia rufa]
MMRRQEDGARGQCKIDKICRATNTSFVSNPINMPASLSLPVSPLCLHTTPTLHKKLTTPYSLSIRSSAQKPSSSDPKPTTTKPSSWVSPDWVTSLTRSLNFAKDDSNIPIATAKLDDVSELLGGALFLPLFKWMIRYGPIYRLAAGPRDFVVVSDPAIAKHVLRNYGKYAKGLVAEVSEFLFGSGFAIAEGQLWTVGNVCIYGFLYCKLFVFKLLEFGIGLKCSNALLLEARASLRLAPQIVEARAQRLDVSSTQLRDDLLSMLVAGHETTGSVLTWTTYLLSKDPSSLKKAQEEVDRVLQGRPPTYEDIKNLKFLTRCINESLRLYPHPPVLLRRAQVPDVLPGNYKVNAGQDIMISVYNIHHSAQVWERAEEFVPERFDLDDPVPNETNTDFRFIPFSGGPRKCVGDQFALMEAIVALAIFLQHMNFELVPDQNISMTTGATIHTTNGLYMKVSQRQTESAFASSSSSLQLNVAMRLKSL